MHALATCIHILEMVATQLLVLNLDNSTNDVEIKDGEIKDGDGLIPLILGIVVAVVVIGLIIILIIIAVILYYLKHRQIHKSYRKYI